MQVRFATAADYPAVIKIVNFIGISPAFNWTEQSLGQELLLSRTLLIGESSESSAFLSFREGSDAFEIMVLGTHPKALRKGLQSRLLAELQKLSDEKKLPIFLEVHSENKSAIALYRKSGFVELPPRRRYYSDGADALTFKWLPNPPIT